MRGGSLVLLHYKSLVPTIFFRPVSIFSNVLKKNSANGASLRYTRKGISASSYVSRLHQTCLIYSLTTAIKFFLLIQFNSLFQIANVELNFINCSAPHVVKFSHSSSERRLRHLLIHIQKEGCRWCFWLPNVFHHNTDTVAHKGPTTHCKLNMIFLATVDFCTCLEG